MSAPHSALSSLLSGTGAFFFALAGVCLLLHAVLPLPDVPDVRAKLDHLAANRGAYDTIFIGSSQVRRQISPQVFDAQMQQAGHLTRSFNMGIDAMTFPELPFVLDRVLALRLPNLRLVVADLNPIRRTLARGSDRNSLRAIYWHDLRRTWMVARAVWRDPVSRPLAEKLELTALHGELMIRNYSNIGRGAEFLQGVLANRTTKKNVVRDRGYSPVERVLEGDAADAFADRVQSMRAGKRRTRRDPVHAEALQELVATIRAHGAEPVLITAPSAGRPRIPAPDSQTVTLHFDDPQAFPSLYDPLHRYDMQHLNAAGSAEFSQMLADRIAPLLKER